MATIVHRLMVVAVVLLPASAGISRMPHVSAESTLKRAPCCPLKTCTLKRSPARCHLRHDTRVTCARTLTLRGGMPAPDYVPHQGLDFDDEIEELCRERALEAEENADELKRLYPTSLVAIALNGSAVHNAVAANHPTHLYIASCWRWWCA